MTNARRRSWIAHLVGVPLLLWAGYRGDFNAPSSLILVYFGMIPGGLFLLHDPKGPVGKTPRWFVRAGAVLVLASCIWALIHSIGPTRLLTIHAALVYLGLSMAVPAAVWETLESATERSATSDEPAI